MVGVIEQLEKTGNRPHLIKELATVLSNINDPVSRYENIEYRVAICSVLTNCSSANPAALLSSRLSTYLKRPGWTALSPCPLNKELTRTHPRKIYYFLTTLPRQDFPADSSDILSAGLGGKGGKRIISPSISSGSIDEDGEGAEERRRDALSPSPEIDLSTHDLDSANPISDDFTTPPTPAGSSFSGRSSLARDGSNGSSSEGVLSHNEEAGPPLEGDEKEFTQTASSMRMRGMSFDDPTVRPSTEDSNEMIVEETEEEKAKRNREAAETLFGTHHASAQDVGMVLTSSPLVKTTAIVVEREVKREGAEDVEMKESILGDAGLGLTWDTREPEDIQIEDLDDLFGAF